MDIAIKNLIDEYMNDQVYAYMRQITRLANVETIFILVIILSFLFMNSRYYVETTALLLSAFFSTFSSQGLKLIFRRNRPAKFEEVNYIGYSFPSGHSTIGVCFYTVLAYIAYNLYGINPIIVILGFILGLLIAFSRIYLSAHWTIDVLYGIALGTACTGWVIYFYDRGLNLVSYFLA